MAAISVLGATGFIGHHVVQELAQRGHTVLAFARDLPRIPFPASVTWQPLELDDVAPDAAGTIAIHLAEPGTATGSDHSAQCVARLQRLLGVAFTRIVYVSSAVVYGDEAATPRNESSSVHPRGVYADAKLATESVAAQDPRCTIVRLSNIYGPGMSPANVLSDILAQVGGAGPLRLRDLAPVRDYLHAGDVARAFADLVEKPVGGVLNFGSGRGVSVEELARIACTAGGQPERVLEATQPAGRASYLVLDPARVREQLGWQPMMSIEMGLTQLLREQKP